VTEADLQAKLLQKATGLSQEAQEASNRRNRLVVITAVVRTPSDGEAVVALFQGLKMKASMNEVQDGGLALEVVEVSGIDTAPFEANDFKVAEPSFDPAD